MSSKEGFLASVDVALLFYRTCGMYKIKTEKQRIELMRKLVARKRVKYLRDVKEFVGGKSVLRITKNGL